jgi:DNA-binding beta-propeller fold protein YncE
MRISKHYSPSASGLRHYFLILSCLMAVAQTAQTARGINVAPGDIRMASAGGGALISLARPVSNGEAASRWNTVVIRPPAPFFWRSGLGIRGRITVDAGPRPSHVGIKVDGVSGKATFVRVRFPSTWREADKEFSFTLNLDETKLDSDEKTSLKPGDQVRSISIFTSHAAPVDSAITLGFFEITTAPSGPAAALGGGAAPTRAASLASLHDGTFAIRPELHGVHPRLYATAAELESAAARYAATPAFFARYLPVNHEMVDTPVPLDEGTTAQFNSMRFAKIAVAYRITGDAKYLARMNEWLPLINAYEPPVMTSIGSSNGLVAGHILLGFAIAYDVLKGCNPDATGELVTAIHDMLIRQGNRLHADLSPRTTFPYEQNHLIIPVCGLAVAAMTLVDEHSDAATWGVFATNILSRSLASIAADGWFFEGFSYWIYTMQFPGAYAAARQRVMGDNILDAPPFRDAPAYLAHMTLPERQFVFDFGDWGPRVEAGDGFQVGYDWPWHTLPTRVKSLVPNIMLHSGPESPASDQRLAFLDDYMRSVTPIDASMTGSYAIDAIFGMLLQIPAPPAMRPMRDDHASYPPYHYFPDNDVLHWRANWSDPAATAIAFRSGPPAGHAFAGLIKQYPEWRPSLGHAHPDAGSFILSSKGVFLANDTGYTGAKETADHNSILIDGTGQHKGGTPWSTFDGKPYDEYNRIRLSDTWLAPRVAAATADFAAAYDDALGISRMTRDLILIGGRFLVIRDTIHTATPRTREWRLHSDQAAVPLSANRFQMTNGPARLVVESVGDHAVTPAIRPTVVETQTFAGPPRPQQRGHHLALATGASTDAGFLVAMSIQDTATGRPEKFSVSRFADDPSKLELVDGGTRCTVWLNGSAELDGGFAYVLRDAATGRVLDVAIHGTARGGELLRLAGQLAAQYKTAAAALALDEAGTLYIANTARNTIDRIGAEDSAEILAGSPDGDAGHLNATGTLARFNRPSGVALRTGTLYVADAGNRAIRTVNIATRAVGTLTGAPLSFGDGEALDGDKNTARFKSPSGLAVDSAGLLYVADAGAHAIRAVSHDGAVTTIAGRLNFSGNDAAHLDTPRGLALAAADDALYIADSGNHLIRKIEPGAAPGDGFTMTTIAGVPGEPGDNDGPANTGGAEERARFHSPAGIAAAGGDIYIADTENSTIRKITGGRVETLAGIAGWHGLRDATPALYNHPEGIAAGPDGELYIADTGNQAIRVIMDTQTGETVTPVIPPAPPSPDAGPGDGGGGGGGRDDGGGGTAGQGRGGGGLPSKLFLFAFAMFVFARR